MDIIPGGASSLPWYDRGPTLKMVSYTGLSQSPHGGTVRGSFTVSVGKKAHVGAWNFHVQRRTVASSGANVVVRILITPSGGASATIILGSFPSNMVETIGTRNGVFNSILTAGDEIALSTTDASTGGTVDYILSILISEFEA